MKRLLLATLLLMLIIPALAESEDEAAAFVAEHLLGYTFIDGAKFDETAMLLVKDQAGLVS